MNNPMKRIIAVETAPEMQFLRANQHIDDVATPDNFILIGNGYGCGLHEEENPHYDHLLSTFMFMAEPLDEEVLPVAELLDQYGFRPPFDRKEWTQKELAEWQRLIDLPCPVTNTRLLASAMTLLTGHQWREAYVTGNVQRDYAEILYNADELDGDQVTILGRAWFNAGTSWEIHTEWVHDGVAYCDDVTHLYLSGWEFEDEIQQAISDHVNAITGEDYPPESVTLVMRADC